MVEVVRGSSQTSRAPPVFEQVGSVFDRYGPRLGVEGGDLGRLLRVEHGNGHDGYPVDAIRPAWVPKNVDRVPGFVITGN